MHATKRRSFIPVNVKVPQTAEFGFIRLFPWELRNTATCPATAFRCT
jgi:hypothetical protein